MSVRDQLKILSNCLLLVLAFLVMSSCQSPLFNQAAYQAPAGDQSNTPQKSSVTDNDCPLEFKSEKVCASLTWVAGPSLSSVDQFDLEFWRARKDKSETKIAFTPSDLRVKLWMQTEHMSHGSSAVKLSPLKDAEGNIIAGRYRITEVNFLMEGPWQIYIDFFKDQKLSERVIYHLSVGP